MTDLENKTAAVLAAIAAGVMSLDRVKYLHQYGQRQLVDSIHRGTLSEAYKLKIEAYGEAIRQIEEKRAMNVSLR